MCVPSRYSSVLDHGRQDHSRIKEQGMGKKRERCASDDDSFLSA